MKEYLCLHELKSLSRLKRIETILFYLGIELPHGMASIASIRSLEEV
jgi:hypothetical protein